MTHWWKDFNLTTPILGPLLPLTSGQQAMPISGVLPSGEAGFFDLQQDRTLHPTAGGLFPPIAGDVGSGINYPFPSPNVTTADALKYSSGDFYSELYSSFFSNQFTPEWWEESGILNTYGPTPYIADLVEDARPKVGSGTLHPRGFQSPFSNAPRSKVNSINDFTIFNPYIHHKGLPSTSAPGVAIFIPFLSTYKVSIDWDAYGRVNGYNRNL
jgi:hypothetical protein